jgi:hypothetical protein
MAAPLHHREAPTILRAEQSRAEELSDILTGGRGRGDGVGRGGWSGRGGVLVVCGVLCMLWCVGGRLLRNNSIFLSFSFRGRDTLAHPSSMSSVIPDSVRFLRYRSSETSGTYSRMAQDERVMWLSKQALESAAADSSLAMRSRRGEELLVSWQREEEGVEDMKTLTIYFGLPWWRCVVEIFSFGLFFACVTLSLPP